MYILNCDSSRELNYIVSRVHLLREHVLQVYPLILHDLLDLKMNEVLTLFFIVALGHSFAFLEFHSLLFISDVFTSQSWFCNFSKILSEMIKNFKKSKILPKYVAYSLLPSPGPPQGN